MASEGIDVQTCYRCAGWPIVLSIALLIGFFVGTLPLSSAIASSQVSFAGYYLHLSNTGVESYIAYKDPAVINGSSEWVMSTDGTRYIQSGWIKTYAGGGPDYFGEYQSNTCGSTFCRFDYGTVPVNTTHFYSVIRSGTTWCIDVDSVCKTMVSTSTVGFSTGPYSEYDGESHDTLDIIGGTPSSHLRISTLHYKDTSNVWHGVNTTQLVNDTTAGTFYAASTGFSGTSYVDNWTNP